MEKNAELAFFRKIKLKVIFLPKFKSVLVNWHKCNDNCNEA